MPAVERPLTGRELEQFGLQPDREGLPRVALVQILTYDAILEEQDLHTAYGSAIFAWESQRSLSDNEAAASH